MWTAMNRALFTLLALAGLAAGVKHYLNYRRTAVRRPRAEPADDAILASVREGLPPSVDARVRNGVVALRGSASAGERDRALAHALSIPGVTRVYSDFETHAGPQTGAAKSGIAHAR
jgi:hypothetical protein